MKNIQEMIGTDQYARLRFGLGNDYPKGGQIDFVLSHFTEEQYAALLARLQTAVEMIQTFCLAGIQTAMCQFNNK